MILVEPEGGLPKVDHEFYVMQGEVYTEEPMGAKGELTPGLDKLLNEQPEYYIMNGGFKALNTGGSSYGKLDEKIYTDLSSDHPIDLCRYQVANCFMGRAGLINSGGASGKNDFAEATRRPGTRAPCSRASHPTQKSRLLAHGRSRLPAGTSWAPASDKTRTIPVSTSTSTSARWDANRKASIGLPLPLESSSAP